MKKLILIFSTHPLQSRNKDNIGIFSGVESFRSVNDLWALHGNKGYPMIQDHEWIYRRYFISNYNLCEMK